MHIYSMADEADRGLDEGRVVATLQPELIDAFDGSASLISVDLSYRTVDEISES